MTRLIKKLPNIITLLRVMLSLFLNIYIVSYFGNLLIPIIISFTIFLTDFFDGKIARDTGSVSSIGAIFDVVADLFYIVGFYIVLYTFHILPLWFLFIILFKFVEFIVTSNFIKNTFNEKSIFIFDFLGRIVAMIFYIIPLVSYVSFQLLHTGYLLITNLLIYATTLLVFVSSSYRISKCINESRFSDSEYFRKKFFH